MNIELPVLEDTTGYQINRRNRPLLKNLNKDGYFGRIHHGFLNDRRKLTGLSTHCNQHDGYHEIAEGDICWAEEKGEVLLYMKHPYAFNRLPDIEYVRKGIESGEILGFTDIFSDEFSKLNFIIELKNGTGDTRTAFRKMVSLLQEKAKGRYWIDGFSPTYLRQIKEIEPDAPTSLHTRLGVYGRCVIETAFEPPFIAPLNLYKIDWADAVTVTYKYSPTRFLGRKGKEIGKWHDNVFQSGKKLLFGGVESEEVFMDIKESGASGAYLKFDKDRFSEPYETS